MYQVMYIFYYYLQGMDSIYGVMSQLSGGHISSAAIAAASAGEHRLALIVAQACSASSVRHMLRSQLHSWQQTQVNHLISNVPRFSQPFWPCPD